MSERLLTTEQIEVLRANTLLSIGSKLAIKYAQDLTDRINLYNDPLINFPVLSDLTKSALAAETPFVFRIDEDYPLVSMSKLDMNGNLVNGSWIRMGTFYSANPQASASEGAFSVEDVLFAVERVSLQNEAGLVVPRYERHDLAI